MCRVRAEAVAEQTSIRDYLEGEKVVQAFPYLRRREAADEAAVAARLDDARAQLERCPGDPALRAGPAVRHVGLAVVFHGWELAACEAVGDDDPDG